MAAATAGLAGLEHMPKVGTLAMVPSWMVAAGSLHTVTVCWLVTVSTAGATPKGQVHTAVWTTDLPSSLSSLRILRSAYKRMSFGSRPAPEARWPAAPPPPPRAPGYRGLEHGADLSPLIRVIALGGQQGTAAAVAAQQGRGQLGRLLLHRAQLHDLTVCAVGDEIGPAGTAECGPRQYSRKRCSPACALVWAIFSSTGPGRPAKAGARPRALPAGSRSAPPGPPPPGRGSPPPASW